MADQSATWGPTLPVVLTAPATAEPATAQPDLDEQSIAAADRPWVTIVWDDPVNLMNYVTHVFMTVFGYSEQKATDLMLDVHTKGKAVVSAGPRERMEFDVNRLHGYGLWATLSHDS